MISIAIKEKLSDKDFLTISLQDIPSKSDIIDIDKSYFVVKNVVWSTTAVTQNVYVTLIVEPLVK